MEGDDVAHDDVAAEYQRQLASAEAMWERAREEDKLVWQRQREQRQQEWRAKQAAAQREWEARQQVEQQRWESHRQLQQALWEGWKQRQLHERRGPWQQQQQQSQQQQQELLLPAGKRRRLSESLGGCGEADVRCGETTPQLPHQGRSRASLEEEAQTPMAGGDGTAAAAALLERTNTDASTDKGSGASVTLMQHLGPMLHRPTASGSATASLANPLASSAQLCWSAAVAGPQPSASLPTQLLPPMAMQQSRDMKQQLWGQAAEPPLTACSARQGQQGQQGHGAEPLLSLQQQQQQQQQQQLGAMKQQSGLPVPPSEQSWLAAQVDAFEAAMQQGPTPPSGQARACTPLQQVQGQQAQGPRPWGNANNNSGIIGAAHAAAADDWWLDSFLG